MDRTLNQKLLAELVGTFALVFVGAGAVIALRVDGTAGLITIGMAVGLAIATMVTAAAHTSGAHFNPAVTIGAWVTGKIEARDAVGYIVAQLLGGVAAGGLLRTAIPDTFWRTVNLGAPGVNPALSTGQAVLIEAVLSFVVVWVVFAALLDRAGTAGSVAGIAIGFAYLMGIMMGYPFTGGAMNPARWFGPAAAVGTFTHWWVYLIGPIAGGIVAAVVYDSMFIRPREETAAMPEAEFSGEGEIA